MCVLSVGCKLLSTRTQELEVIKKMLYSYSYSNGVYTQDFPSTLHSILRVVLKQINKYGRTQKKFPSKIIVPTQTSAVVQGPLKSSGNIRRGWGFCAFSISSRNRHVFNRSSAESCHPTKLNNPLPPLIQVLVCLRYLATGAIHLLIGDFLNISRSAGGHCIRGIALHIAGLAQRFVVFPNNTAAETQYTFIFCNICRFPKCAGLYRLYPHKVEETKQQWSWFCQQERLPFLECSGSNI